MRRGIVAYNGNNKSDRNIKMQNRDDQNQICCQQKKKKKKNWTSFSLKICSLKGQKMH